jgi:hypothetical protein
MCGRSQAALVQDNCGTSRGWSQLLVSKLDVAKECGEVYKLQPLPSDKSKKLFYTRIFGSDGKCSDTQLDEASFKMLKKCDGVPSVLRKPAVFFLKIAENWWNRTGLNLKTVENDVHSFKILEKYKN